MKNLDYSCVAIPKEIELAKQNIRRLYYTFNELVDLLTVFNFKEIINKTLRQLSRIELLIIVEIGYTHIIK